MFTFKVFEEYTKLPDEYFSFRYKIIHDELGLIDENKDKKDFDEYDKYSIHFIAYDKDNNICATTRLIVNSPLEYPTKKYMNINKEDIPNANFAEFSRVFIKKDKRNFSNARNIMYHFIKDIYYYLVIYDIDFIFASMEKNFIQFLHLNNIHFTQIGEGGQFYGYRYPCLISKNKLINKNPYLNI